MTPEDLVSRIRSGDSDTAISTFLDTNPDISPDVLAANALAWNLDDVTEAILRWVTEKHPDYWECRKQLGLFHLERNRFDTALEQFTALMEARPDDYIGYWGVCTAYSRQGDQKGLRRTIQKAQATMPEGTYVNWQDGALLRSVDNLSVWSGTIWCVLPVGAPDWCASCAGLAQALPGVRARGEVRGKRAPHTLTGSVGRPVFWGKTSSSQSFAQSSVTR